VFESADKEGAAGATSRHNTAQTLCNFIESVLLMRVDGGKDSPVMSALKQQAAGFRHLWGRCPELPPEKYFSL
jgi:hypothetical protein